MGIVAERRLNEAWLRRYEELLMGGWDGEGFGDMFRQVGECCIGRERIC